MGEPHWPLLIHRPPGVGVGADCGQCSTSTSYNGETGACIATTTATYNVQCIVVDTAVTMVFDVTGVTNTEIGQWTCNPAVGLQPEADIIIMELRKAYFLSVM